MFLINNSHDNNCSAWIFGQPSYIKMTKNKFMQITGKTDVGNVVGKIKPFQNKRNIMIIRCVGNF
jgi:hypothetical protein